MFSNIEENLIFGMFPAKVGLPDLTKAREHVKNNDNGSNMVEASNNNIRM
ncbi:hypothetical protein QEJ31_09930 [Pigmentibacter sp. JX0631]|nr:hypothetical protein [Pigmentibacter sp. JX0631]WGL58843.1 hypothetical protein QEJ31_09930 [Pigmentibacter sp. JX0631]